MLDVFDGVNQSFDLLRCHHRRQLGGGAWINKGGNHKGFSNDIPEEKRDALCRHTAFYPATAQGFAQVQQVVDHHVFCKLLRGHITVVNKEVAQFREVVAAGV